MITKLITVLLLISFSSILVAQSIDAILLETNFSGGINPKNITPGATIIYFSADDGIHGRELWIHNPVSNKTNMVKDIFAGEQNSISVSDFVTINDQLYFLANDGLHGIELWKSDGTEDGTFLIKDINIDGDCLINNIILFNGKLVFNAFDQVHGTELWISDGTENGTMLIEDINPGNNSSNPRGFKILNDNLFFIANDGTIGNEIWKSDGTQEGTTLLKDIFPGNNLIFPTIKLVFNQYLVFIANDGISGYEIWTSDGTPQGTKLLKDINPNAAHSMSSESKFIVFGDSFYFFANNGISGFELWKSDGTPQGTQLLKDIYIGPNNSSVNFEGNATSTFFIFTAKSTSNVKELWRSNGTAEGTSPLREINSNFDFVGASWGFVTYNDRIFFNAYTIDEGFELWVTDGSYSGTHILKDINIGSMSGSVAKITPRLGLLIFAASDGSTSTLWKSDGTYAGTVKLKDISLNQTSDTELSFVELNGMMYFQAGNGSLDGLELWKTDGTTENTMMVFTGYHRNGGMTRNPDFILYNDKIIYGATNGIDGIEPFVTDGSINGTRMIKDINPSDNSSILYLDFYRPSFTKAGNEVYFMGNNGTSGFELFKTDGTETGTSIVKDIVPGGISSISSNTLFMSLNNIVLFKANDKIHGEELWRSDGTEQGTYMLKDFNPGIGDGITSSNLFKDDEFEVNEICYANHNDEIYFIAYDGSEYGIWKTDGTSVGTQKAISTTYPFKPEIINYANNRIFYKTQVPSSFAVEEAIWATDGTQENTILLDSWAISGIPSQFEKNIVFKNELYFTVFSNTGLTLMKSDGTTEGTVKVTKEYFTTEYSFCSLIPCGNFVYFTTGNIGISVGKELWKTDGTLNGTVLIEKVPYESSEHFKECTCIKDNLLYLKEFIPDKIWYVNELSLIPDFFELNILNGSNFINDYEGIINVFSINNNLFFEGNAQESGFELYYADIKNFLNIIEVKNENSNISRLLIYPNPSSDKIFIQSKNEENPQFQIFDIFGREITKTYSYEIDISELNSGVYFVIALDKNHRFLGKVKFVKM